MGAPPVYDALSIFTTRCVALMLNTVGSGTTPGVEFDVCSTRLALDGPQPLPPLLTPKLLQASTAKETD
eukprot:4424732-Prymnesium_polylepis.1